MKWVLIILLVLFIAARPGTPAAQFSADDVPLEVKKKRLGILQARILLNTKTISEAMIGTVRQVLVTGDAKKDAAQLSGRTENNRVVNFDGDKRLDWHDCHASDY